MKVAIVQPNFLPWRGAFDLINKVDNYIFLDTVQYTKRDWRNRNRFLQSDGRQSWMTVPVKGSRSSKINEVVIDYEKDWRSKHLRGLSMAYGKSASFDIGYKLLEQAYDTRPELLVDLTIPLTIEIAQFLGIKTQFRIASELNSTVAGKNERLISLAKLVGATSYLSGPVALDYLETGLWENAGLAVEVMEYPEYPNYPQISDESIPNLSILDLIFMTGHDASDYI